MNNVYLFYELNSTIDVKVEQPLAETFLLMDEYKPLEMFYLDSD